MRPLLILDFDGTVCLGDDPVRIYADEVNSRIEGHSDLMGKVDAFFAGSLSIPGVEDGYHAVAHLGREIGLVDQDLNAAYVNSRRRISQGEGELHLPGGFLDFLHELNTQGTGVVLLTNAPETGATSWLDAMGVTPLLDGLITEAGKPQRMMHHLQTLLDEWNLTDTPQRLASVGDVWTNDIAPAMELGACGFYIDRFGLQAGPATATAESFIDLYPEILRWSRAVTKP